MKSNVERLSSWYASQCDGKWEHGNGFDIGTLDNPGVSLDVDLRGTSLESVPFTEQNQFPGIKDKWLLCRRTDDRFEGRGAPSRLEDILNYFLDWAEAHG